MGVDPRRPRSPTSAFAAQQAMWRSSDLRKPARVHATVTACTSLRVTIVRMCPRLVGKLPVRKLLVRKLLVRKLGSVSLRLLLVALFCTAPLWAASSTVVISQLYTAGGNSGAVYNADYVELFNLSSAPVNLTGWALQYFAAGATATSTPVISPLTGNITLQPGQRYLIQATPGSTGASLPSTADQTSSNLAMGAAAGRIYVTSSTAALSNASGCPANYVDFVGYGTTANCYEGTKAAPAPSTSLALFRSNACVDKDQNGTEFVTAAPAPRNSTSALTSCSVTLLTSAAASPSTVVAGTATLLSATGTPGLNVTADLSAFNGGSSTQPLFDDGSHGDATSGDGTYSYTFTVPANTPPTSYTINVTGINSSLTTVQVSTAIAVQLPLAFTPIHTIQGSTPGASAYAGQTVLTHGIVTGTLASGFYLQARDAEADADPNTSEGIYVYTGSGKVPTTAVPGNELQVSGTVALYPSAAVPPGTELDSPSGFTVLSTGNVLPTAISLTTSFPSPAGGVLQLPRVQSMRVIVPSLTVTQPTDGTLSEANETYTSNGQFWGEVTGLPRPTREAGLDVRDPLTSSQAASIPRFDSDPETFLLDSSAAPGGPGALNLATGAVLTSVAGIMDLSSTADTPRLVLDPVNRPTVVSAGISAVAVPDANPGELTIGDQNMERFYDTMDDPSTSDVVLTPAAYQLRLAKASLGIRNILKTPDILAMEEMESLTALTDLANKISADAVAGNQPDPHYQPYLVPGNDVGGINVAFLVNPAKVNVLSVQQFGKNTTFTNAAGAQAILNDRPPLVLHAGIKRAGAPDYPLTVIVNHLRSLNSITDPATGPTVRLKREGQAEYLANLTQGYQAAGEHVLSVGDFNAFDVNDGLVDSLGVIKGGPALTGMDVVPGTYGLVNPFLVDAAPTDVPNGAYSYVFSGYAQSIDHFLVTADIAGQIRTAPAHWNADFPVIFRNDATRPEASSDHDGIVGYLAVPAVVAGPPQLTSTSSFSRLPDGSYQLSLTVANSGTGPAPAAQISAAVVGSTATTTALPLNLGDIAAGGSSVVVLSFPASAGASGSRVVERLTGTYTGGTFGGSLRTALP